MRKTVGKIAIALLLSLHLFLPGSWLFSQSAAANRPELDHTTVFVRDLPKSVEFYEKVVGLERTPRKPRGMTLMFTPLSGWHRCRTL